MPAALAQRFAKVRAAPAAPTARREAAAILAALAKLEEPAESDIGLLVDDAFVWVGLGFAREARDIVEQWLRADVRGSATPGVGGRGGGRELSGVGGRADARQVSGVGGRGVVRGLSGADTQMSGPAPGLGVERRLKRAAAIYTVAIAPAAAAGRLRAIADDPVAVAATVANHVFRGELRAAVELCKAHGWFLDRPEAMSGVAYGVWSLAMLDDFDGALAVIATWRHRHPVLPPQQEQALLSTEARVESIRHHHARERALLEEALAVCDDAGLGLERAYLEASYAIALLRSGELQAGAKIARTWGTPKDKKRVRPSEALELYRHVARTEFMLLEDKLRAADLSARLVMDYADYHGNLVYACLARFHRVLAATPAARPALLDDYGRIAAQLQIPLHLRRHRLLEQLTGDKKLVVRTRRRKRSEPILRLFFPVLADLGSDLCWDRVQGTLYLGGDGPFSLADHPIVRRVLEAILATPDFQLPIATLFERVWEMTYDPLRHEGKCHVALHRLRALLGGWRAGADRLVQVRDGTVRIADDASVCVIELPNQALPRAAATTAEPASGDSLADRVHAHLAATGDASPAEIASRIGVSRSALLLVLRTLTAEGRIARTGRARAIRYRAC